MAASLPNVLDTGSCDCHNCHCKRRGWCGIFRERLRHCRWDATGMGTAATLYIASCILYLVSMQPSVFVALHGVFCWSWL